jgi:hypothetical protein
MVDPKHVADDAEVRQACYGHHFKAGTMCAAAVKLLQLQHLADNMLV